MKKGSEGRWSGKEDRMYRGTVFRKRKPGTGRN